MGSPIEIEAKDAFSSELEWQERPCEMSKQEREPAHRLDVMVISCILLQPADQLFLIGLRIRQNQHTALARE
jgi:hypothetical protein